jgi:hypothetical protein
MDTGFTIAQEDLHEFMSKLSERCYCAGWLIGTEFRLWEYMTDAEDDGDWGYYRLFSEDRQALESLSQKAEGWVYWASAEQGRTFGGPAFATFVDWLNVYASWVATRKFERGDPRRHLQDP